MWDYSDKVKDHFFNPRNSGVLESANAIGDVGSMNCGDALRLMMQVEPSTERILDARFQTFGCGSAIASSSALTEMIKGKTLDEALQISNQDIADFLDGLPPEKMHCSVMGREALHAAVAHYRGEALAEAHDEGALICKCFAVDSILVEETARSNHLSTVEEVIHYTKAGGGCSSCHEDIENILAKVMKERGEVFSPHAVKLDSPAITRSSLTNLQRIRRIESIIDTIRPQLQRDHGDIELVDVDGKTIYVNMIGACAGCQMEALTLQGIQHRLVEDLGELVRLVPSRTGSYSRASCQP